MLARRRSWVGSGFSLVELLVVVAVIAVLAGILIPAVGRIRENTRLTQCVNNLRQISNGMALYANEHHNQTPRPSTTGDSSNQKNTWGYALWPYIYGSYDNYNDLPSAGPMNCMQMGTPVYDPCPENVFRCPSNREGDYPIAGGGVLSSRHSYGFNFGAGNALVDGDERKTPVNLLTVREPAKTAMVLECSTPFAHRSVFRSWGLAPHRGKLNVLYYDGHVQLMDPQDIPNSNTDTFWSL